MVEEKVHSQRILIVGGTGLLGYHSGLEFLRRGFQVTALAIQDIDLTGWFPEEIEVVYGDVFTMSTQELVSHFRGFHAMVYAVGPDDRSLPDAPAEQFFQEYLVEACTRVFESARIAGVKRAVLLNSYFTHFHRKWPHLNLAKRHPYIGARVTQAEQVVKISQPGMETMVLELPYIFGIMPKRIPIWRDVFFERLIPMNPIFYPRGGSSMIRVENVAEAVAGAVENGEHGIHYAIGDVNMPWDEMFSIMFRAIGIKRILICLPLWLGRIVGTTMMWRELRNGKEPGLNLSFVFKDIISRKFYLDPEQSAVILGYGSGNVAEAIAQSAQACFPDGYRRKEFRKSIR